MVKAGESRWGAPVPSSPLACACAFSGRPGSAWFRLRFGPDGTMEEGGPLRLVTSPWRPVARPAEKGKERERERERESWQMAHSTLYLPLGGALDLQEEIKPALQSECELITNRSLHCINKHFSAI